MIYSISVFPFLVEVISVFHMVTISPVLHYLVAFSGIFLDCCYMDGCFDELGELDGSIILEVDMCEYERQ